MKVFFNLLAVQLILNLYVFFKGWCIIPPRYSKLRSVYMAVFAFEILVYAVTAIWHNSFGFSVYRVLLLSCTAWSFFILYMTLILLAISFVRLLMRVGVRWLGKSMSKDTSMFYKRSTFVFAFAATALILLAGNLNFLYPSVNEVNITVDKEVEGSIPNSLRIAMLSDMHLGYINEKDILKKYVNLILKQNPDLILIGGDIIDYTLQPIIEDNMVEQFHRLKAPLGVYACLGNHDYYADGDEKVKWLKEKSGITILQDSVAVIDSTLYIVGREDFKSPRKLLNNLLTGVDTSRPIFVLNHQPVNLSEEVSANVDLALYGHTHDGQIFPLTEMLRVWYEMSCGYEKRHNTHLFVTSGLGGIPQLRIGSKSELIIVNCTFAKSNN